MATRLRLPLIDWPMLGASGLLLVIGLATVYSATTVPGAHEGLWTRQLTWLVLALGAGWVATSLHYRAHDSLAYPLYGISLVLLLAVLAFGTSAFGAKRWLELGPLRFQPSEIAKIATVFVLARQLSHPKLDLTRFRDWFPPLLVALVPFALVAEEPDLGTSLSFPAILVAMFFWAGMPAGTLALGLSPGFTLVLSFLLNPRQLPFWLTLGLTLAVAIALVRPRRMLLMTALVLNLGVAFAMPIVKDRLHDYQLRRIETFLNPDQDPHGAGYQIIQSRIAIGSGGLLGKGWLRGTQKGLSFLPMRHTDFIFAVVGEERGLLGALTVVILYGLIILRGYRLAAVARNGFASLMTVGLVTAFFYHVIVNILMTIGWAPVTGLPLPLLSYGGTALVVNCIQLGLLQNVALRRQEY
ncbi:MAG: rod shape-determining protein RodA [Candidatus Eiseniibacteriota bacterium]